MRLIDANALVEELHKHFGIGFDEDEWWNSSHVLTAIAWTSTVDAIPVEFIKAEMDRAVDDINLAMEDGETEWAERTIVRKATLEFTLAKWKHMCSNCQEFDCYGCKYKREEE